MTSPTPMSRPRLAGRPRQILDEAIRIIGQKGYYGFGLKDLAQHCGLTVAGVLYHFGTKAGLLVALLEDRDLRDHEAVFPGLAARGKAAVDMEGVDEMKRVLHDVVTRNVRQPELVQLYSMLRTEAVFEDHPAYDYFRRRSRLACETMVAMLGKRVADPEATAFQLLAIMSGLEDLWLRDRAGFDLVKQWDAAIARLLPPAGGSAVALPQRTHPAA